MKSENTFNRKKIASALCLLLASVVWGGAFVAQTFAGRSVGTLTFNAIRFIMAGLCLLPMLRGNLRNLSKVPSSKLKGGIICGAALFLASAFQQAGIAAGAGTGEAGFITAFYIVLVPVLSVFLGKKCSKIVYLAVMVALLGLYFLCFSAGDTIGTSGNSIISTADLLLLGCAFVFSVQILSVDHYAPQMSPIALSCVQFFTGGIFSFIFAIFFEIMPDPSGWLMSLSTVSAWISLLYTGIFSSAIGYTLQAVGQRNINPTVASLIMSMESVFSTLFGWLILHQVLSGREILGCCLVFVAIILAQIPSGLKLQAGSTRLRKADKDSPGELS